MSARAARFVISGRVQGVGYRAWTGLKSPAWSRWVVVALVGIQLALRSTWLSRTLIVSWIPAVGVGIGFFLYEQSMVNPDLKRGLANTVTMITGNLELRNQMLADPESVREQVWSSLVLFFFRYPQAVMMVIVVGIVAPRLISYDIRNRGYLLYFSRPLHVAEYVFGKSLVICFFLALITTLPALALYIIGVFLSPQFDVVLLTWDLPIKIFAASFVLMLVVSSVALACSAMTIESRFAAFSWFAIWIVGWVAYSVLSAGETMGYERSTRGRMSDEQRIVDIAQFQSRWELISPYHLLGRVQQWVFGLYPEDKAIWPYLLVLGLITLVSLALVVSRLRGRLRS